MRKRDSMTISMVSVESDLYLISCLHPKYHCKLKQSCQLCKTDRCIYSILSKNIWGSSITQMLRQKNRGNGSKIKVSQRPKPLKFLNLMPLGGAKKARPDISFNFFKWPFQWPFQWLFQ